tara:strand:+ start:9320 stop:11197 length:1878 start_codon:yes stop_codon:yes gene_type:complete
MEIINNSKTNYNFLFVDSSISEKNLIDFISTNKNCRIISFDFESADILKKRNIKFEHSETFLKNFDYTDLQNKIYKISEWYKNSHISEFLIYKNINIGKLFYDQLLDYLVKSCKNIFEIKAIHEESPESKYFVSRNLHSIITQFSKDVSLIYGENLKPDNEQTKLNLKFKNFNKSISLSQRKYKKIKFFADTLLSNTFSPSLKKTNSSRLLLVEFNTSKFGNFFNHLANSGLELIFYGIRRPAFWNYRTFSNIVKSKCKIINSSLISPKTSEEFLNNFDNFKIKFNKLWNQTELLNSIFQIDNFPMWPTIKNDIKHLLESEIKSSIKYIDNIFENFQKYNIDGVCILSEIGYTEQLAIAAAKYMKIPTFLIQHGVYYDTANANKMNHSQGIYPIESDFYLCYGLPQKNDCVTNSNISDSKIIPVGTIQFDELINQPVGDDNYVLLVTTGPQFENVEAHRYSNLKKYLETIREICNVVQNNNLRIIIKQHPSPREYSLKDYIQKFDPNITIHSVGDVIPLIKRAKFVISIGVSTVILESLLLKKSTLAFEGIDYHWGQPSILNGCVMVNTNNLDGTIKKLLTDINFKNEITSKSHKFLEKYLVNLENSVPFSTKFIKNNLIGRKTM